MRNDHPQHGAPWQLTIFKIRPYVKETFLTWDPV